MTAAEVRPGEGWRIAVAGARGFVGSSLTPWLEAQGHTVIRIGRPGGKERVDIEWDPARGELRPESLAGVDAVVNVVGETVGQRWSEAAKQRIVESRVRPTALLAGTIASMSPRPRVLLNMSALGFYGDGGNVVLDESAPSGDGFLASVVRTWETATAPARDAGVRLVIARSGVILYPSVGMLERLVPIFTLGIGGTIGSARQWLSWISRTDVVRALTWLLTNESAEGVFNVTSPEPVTNEEFTRTLARVLHRPSLFNMPAFGVRLLYGQMGVETVLGGQRAIPRRLLDAGFTFQLPALEAALRHEMAKS